jgi:hypothetical protein
MRRWIPIVMLLASLPGGQPVLAQSDGPATVASVSHGIRIVLTVPKQVYPKDALAKFTVTVQNVSQSNRYLQDVPPDWDGPYSPHILMRTSTGSYIYEEQLSEFLAPTPGTLAGDYVLRPGESVTRDVRFVLGGADVRAVARAADGYTSLVNKPGTPTPPASARARHLWHVASPWLRLALTHEAAPIVKVTRGGNHLHITATAPWATSGPMLYMDSARCWYHGSVMGVNQHVSWTDAQQGQFISVLSPHCPSAQPWRAVIGWSDHRVAEVSYGNASAIH